MGFGEVGSRYEALSVTKLKASFSASGQIANGVSSRLQSEVLVNGLTDVAFVERKGGGADGLKGHGTLQVMDQFSQNGVEPGRGIEVMIWSFKERLESIIYGGELGVKMSVLVGAK